MKKMSILFCVILAAATLWADNTKATNTQSNDATLMLKSGNRVLVSQPAQLPLGRDVLVQQLTDSLACNGYACQLDSVYPFFSDMVDDITLPGGNWQITHVTTYWSNWNGFSSWANVPNIHVMVYADAGGATPAPVDSPFLHIVIQQADYTVVDYGDVMHYRIDFDVSEPLVLTGGVRLWFEVCPSNVFTVNGQTGWGGQSGISGGNGQESYIRFPLLGYDPWVTATTVFGEPIELAMIIEGSIAGDSVHDARATAIVAPGARVAPLVAVAPVAKYRNVGQYTENFTTNFVIDSLGTVVYNQSVPLTAIPPSVETTITFPDWTPNASDGFIYNLTAFTVLTGDENPANDTLHRTTTISLVSEWIQCANVPVSIMCQGTGYDPDNDKIYLFNGAPDGYGTYYNSTYQYDPVANSWATMAASPHAHNWVDATYANGKFYVFGGFDGGTAYNYNMIYDIAGNSWSNGTVMPLARMCGGQVVYNDSLIYMLGGSTSSAPTNNVQIYNTYTNAWTTGTALPTNFQMGGVAIVNNVIYIVGGYDGSAALPNLIEGTIDPTTNETITWTTGAALPVPNCIQGATQIYRAGKWYLYLVGGFENLATATNKAWEYDIDLGTWTQLPNYPMVIVRNDFLVAREGYNEIYVAGGAPGTWYGTDQCWKLVWTVPPGAEEKPGSTPTTAIGFAPNMNPVKSHVSLSYTTPQGNVNLKVYDGMGRLVKVLAQGTQPAGTKTVTWNFKDESGRSLMSGVYFVRLEANGQTMSQKLVLVK